MSNNQARSLAAKNVSCPSQQTLTAFALGNLPVELLDGIADHVEGCSTCRDKAQQLDSVADSFVETLKAVSDCVAESGIALEEQLRAAEQISQVAWPDEPDQDAVHESVPTQLVQYELLDQLGRGGMGIVYRARHLKLKRFAAIKVLEASRFQNAAGIARFHDEMVAVAALDHPNIVRAWDANEVDGRPFLVMELVEGLDLKRQVRRYGPLPIADACEIVRQAAVGLQHAHEKGFIHRDIKPSNLMLTPGGEVKLLDLGLARLLTIGGDGGSTPGDVRVGTPDFMAPEQAVDARQADARSDLYSLGCTLFFLLTGQPPYGEPRFSTSAEKLQAHAEVEIPDVHSLRAEVPESVVAVLNKLLAKQPDERFQTAAELVDALGPVSAESRFSRPDNLSRANNWRASSGESVWASRRWLATTILLAMVCGISLAGVFLPPALARWKLAAQQQEAAKMLAELPVGPVDQAFIDAVRRLLPEAQVQVVAAKLRQLNPKSRGTVRHEILGDKVVSLAFDPFDVTDISPVQALGDLELLRCGSPRALAYGDIEDLRPLRTLRLKQIWFAWNRVSDLTPLSKMPLQVIDCAANSISTLEPLRGLALRELYCHTNKISGLTPLTGMPLQVLNCGANPISDLNPLVGMKLNSIAIFNLPIDSLEALKSMPLAYVWCGETQIRDLSPLRGMPLKLLNCTGSPIQSLEPLRESPLEALNCQHIATRDLSPLADTPLQKLFVSLDSNDDLRQLQEIKTLKELNGRPWSPRSQATERKGQ